jgi:CubicO group peptidase (beta-lactamase class C family)
VATSWQTPVYSNEAYELLAQAYLRITGETLGTAFQTGMVNPLNLTRTFWTPPKNDSNMVRVDMEPDGTYEMDLGAEDP